MLPDLPQPKRHTPILLRGIVSLMADPAGVIAVLTLLAVSFLCFEHRVGDMAFASVASVLVGMIGAMKHGAFTGSDIDRLHENSPPGQ